jgi:GntR family transcriptional regulator, arabinose operon transcriptional repressor
MVMSIPKYEIVKQYITDKILQNELRPGDRILSENELVDLLQVSRHTIRKALNDLLYEGVIITYKGKGSFVAEIEPIIEGIVTGTSKLVAIVTAFINDTIFPDIVSGIEKELSLAGYSIILLTTQNRVDKEREVLTKLMTFDLAGIIVEPTKSALPNPNIPLYEHLKGKGVPIIFMHGYYAAMDCDYVIVDDIKAAYNATKYLINAGHQSIGGIFKSDDIQGHRRYQGYIQAMFDSNIHIDENFIMWQSTEAEHAIFQDKGLLQDYIHRINQCTALLCYNDEFAIELMEAMETNAIKVPENVSIIAFDNTKLGDTYKVKITSVDHPKIKLGNVVAHQLLEKMIHPHEILKTVLEVDLVVKESVSERGVR